MPPTPKKSPKKSPKGKAKGKGKKKGKKKGSQVGKPWIGFAVKNSKGKPTILVKDVAEGGPAEKAGLLDGDELVSVNKKPVPTLQAFRAAIVGIKAKKKLKIVVLRDSGGVDNAIKKTVTVTVVSKVKEIIDFPPLRSLEDLQHVIMDPNMMHRASLACFAELDSDLSGLVTREEFMTGLKQWLPPQLSKDLSENEMKLIFDNVDVDNSGYLVRSEFPPVLELVFRAILSFSLTPIIGFNVHKPRGTSSLYVKVVWAGGPAERAGLLPNDEIATFNGIQVPTLKAFRGIARTLQVGQVCRLEVLRVDPYTQAPTYHTLHLVVEGREKNIMLPPMKTAQDLEAILQDPAKFQIVALSAFLSADKDLCGLLDRQEFVVSMREWLIQWGGKWLSDLISDNDLYSLFERADIDGAGFLDQEEFNPVVEGLLRCLAAGMAAAVTAASQLLASVSGGGRPWLGFEAHKVKGKRNIYVADVAEEGPADKAGLQDGDEIVSVGGTFTPDMNGFKDALQRLRVGQVVRVELNRNMDGSYETLRHDIIVGCRKKKVVSNVPPARTVAEIEAVLADSFKLERLATAYFVEADEDFGGLVDASEFKAVMRHYMPPEISKAVKDSDLDQLFQAIDIDRSGYLAKSEFQTAVEGVLRLQVGFMKGTIKSVSEVIALLMSVAPPKEGSPWLGFQAHICKGKTGVMVQEVAEDGPADKAGLSDGDQLVSVAGEQIKDMDSFRHATRDIQVGQNIKIVILRGKACTTVDLTVGARKRKIVTNVPPMNTLKDIEAILEDSFKLDRLSASIFYEADDDFSGLVDVKEFKKVMRRRIPQELSKMLKDSDLEQLFEMVDRDHSGFLSRSEFQPVVEGVLKLMIGLQNGTIKTVQELIAILNSVAPPKEGSPWLGFEAQLISGASNISVKDVVEDGPADTAGLLNGDIIVSLSNIPMTEMRIFREFTKTIEVNKTIKVQLMREGAYKSLDLKVGARKKKVITNVPRMSTVEDMEAILKDPNKLQRISAAVFADADIDFSGLIDSREFRTALRQRLPPQISRMVQDADLNYLFDSVDKDKSGFLGQTEFVKVMEAVLHTLIGFSKGTIRSVEEVVMKLTGAPPQKEGLPWLGFDVRLGGDKKTVFITGVTEDGPADKVGILDGDQLFSIGGKTIHDLTTFRTLVKSLTVGKPVQIVVLRGGNCVTLELIVGAKKRKQIANVPPMETVQDLQDILADSFKLATLATSFFNEADDDCSGMIDKNEFLGAMRNWLPSSLQRLLRETDLIALFDMVDVDRSGLLSKVEFPPVIEGLVRLLLGFMNGTITDVSQVVALLTSAAPPEQGTPWIGIVAKDHPKVKAIKVQDIAEGGPADKAGVLVGDYITSIANHPVPDAATYLKVLRDLQVGKTVDAQVGHEGDSNPKRISITVGAREFKPVANVPPTKTTADLEALLLDPSKLERLALAIFTDADKDFSGLVDAKEFKTALRSFLPAEFSNVLKDHDLDALFRQVDDDHSGYLTKTEFTPLVEGLVKSLIKYHYNGVVDASALAGEVSHGRPWLGMEVKPAEGRPAIIVQDVSPNGPAAKAGVRPLDEIVTLDGKRTPRVDTFIKTVRGLSVGQVIKVELLRDSHGSGSDAELYRRFNLIVGVKQKEEVKDVPRMETVQDLKSILNDSYKLERAATSAFVTADDDMSGLVDEGEFASAIKRWLHQWGGKKLSELLTDAELLDLFHRVDVDKSHYLSRAEFLPVMEGLLQMIIDASEGKQSKDTLLNSAPPEVGSAWLGMEVKNGHGAVTVVEVVPSGPASKAGIASGDDILSIANHAVPDIGAFRTALRGLTVGQTVPLQVRRHGSVSSKNITVAPRVKEVVKDVPPMYTAEDIYRLIRDPHLLQIVMAYLWSETDTDFSGLVSCREFILSLRRIMPPSLSALFTDAELEQRFRDLDVDGSGFLKRTEFCVMVENLLSMLAKHAPSASQAREFVPHPDAYQLRLGIHEAFPWSVDGASRVRVEVTVGDQRYTTGSGRRGQHGIIWAEECVIWVLGSDVAEIALFNEDTGVVMTKAPVRGSTLTHMLGTKFWTPLPNLGGSQLLLSVDGEGSLSGLSSPHSRVRRVVVVGAPVAATKAEPVVVTVPAPSVSLQHSAIVVRSVASTSTMVPNAPSSVLRVASPQRVEHVHEVPASPPPVHIRLSAAPTYSPTHEYSPPKAYYRVPAATVTYEQHPYSVGVSIMYIFTQHENVI